MVRVLLAQVRQRIVKADPLKMSGEGLVGLAHVSEGFPEVTQRRGQVTDRASVLLNGALLCLICP